MTIPDLAEEIVDMEAQVAFLVRLAADDQRALDDQIARTTAAFHTDDPNRWPASSYMAIRALRETLRDRHGRLDAARTYLADLKEMQ